MFPFGKDFLYPFLPLILDEPVQIAPDISPSIYIYNRKPSRDEAANGTGSPLQTISTWTEIDTYTREISIDAIDDPDPDSESVTNDFWIAINFLISGSEQSQLVIRRLNMGRISAHHSKLSTTLDTLKGIFSVIDSYATQLEITSFATQASIDIRAYLTSKGYEWAGVYDPSQLNRALDYRTLYLFAGSQRGDEFREKRAEWKKEYDTLVSNLKFEYGTANPGNPETKVTHRDFAIVSR